ncbi:MAG: hypothetical protein N2512_08990, partial [Armatimonadetes bacterium]|nr:hypothetical protein [Armatimonadota bacterium]
VLTVVSNLQVDAGATVLLRWTGKWQPKLTNALTGEPLPFLDGRLQVRLKPETFILFRACN